jgi:nitrite reductase (NO-forming)
VLVATTETLIALALITGFARKVTYTAAIVFSVLIWSTAEGFGGPYTSSASDIGTGIIYAVVFAGLLALSYYAGPARLSADHYLEKKISWWWRVAEMRSPIPAAVTPAPHSAVTVPAQAVEVAPNSIPPSATPHDEVEATR